MFFQRARTKEQFNDRQKEIMAACDKLYLQNGFDNVNFKAISEITSLTRPSIYNYYKTKEEIFLAILQAEYLDWYQELKDHFSKTTSMSKHEYCMVLATTLFNHEKLLQLLSIHLTAIEQNCRLEKLVEFKQACAYVFEIIIDSINNYFPATPEDKKIIFYSSFFTFLLGIYPITHFSEKQQMAINETNLAKLKAPTFKTLTMNILELITAQLIEN